MFSFFLESATIIEGDFFLTEAIECFAGRQTSSTMPTFQKTIDCTPHND